MEPLDHGSPHWANDLRHRIDELIDEYRSTLHDCLDDLSEEEARMSLVPSKTTLLGLVKHVTFVEGFWFDQAVTAAALRPSASHQPPTGPSPSARRTPSPRAGRASASLPNALAGGWPH